MDDNLKVMVVEDEPLLLEAIGAKLEKEGMTSILCSDGRQAIDRLKSETELPDAIWLDYYLKDMDGLAFVSELKQDPKLQEVPIIVVSNSASNDKVRHMLGLGVKKYLLKAQYRLEDIIAIIKELKPSQQNSG